MDHHSILRNFPLLLAVAALPLHFGCAPEKPAALRVGLNPWPAYEFLYLAQEKGFYRAEGIEVRLVEFNSLSDARRAYERGQINVLASTVIEVLQARDNSPRSPQIVQVVDYHRAIAYTRQNPADAHRIMAEREGLTPEEFRAALTGGIQLLSESDQADYLRPGGKLAAVIDRSDRILRQSGQIKGPRSPRQRCHRSLCRNAIIAMNRPKPRKVLECASPLALFQGGPASPKRQRTAALQDAGATTEALRGSWPRGVSTVGGRSSP